MGDVSLDGPLDDLTGWAIEIIEALGYLGIGVLMLLANLLPPLPVELVLPLTGFVVSQGRMELLGVLLATTAGSVAGALVLYAPGYWLGEQRLRRLIRRFGRFSPVKESAFDGACRWFESHGGRAVVLGRVSPGLRSLIPIPAGIIRMPLRRFAAYVLFGNGLYNSLLVGFGWVVGDQWTLVVRYASFLKYGLLFIMVLVAFRFLRKRWRLRG